MRDVRALDRISFTDWFKGHGGSQGSIDRMWYATVLPFGAVALLSTLAGKRACFPLGRQELKCFPSHAWIC